MNKFISTPREKRILVLSILCLVLFVFYKFIYSPINNLDQSLQDKILISQKQLKKLTVAIEQNKKYNKDYSLAYECFKQSASDKEQINLIKNEIEMIAKEKSLGISVSLPIKSKSTKSTSYFATNVSLSGKLNDIWEFLHAIQNCPHLYNILELDLATQNSNNNQIQAQLLLERSLIK